MRRLRTTSAYLRWLGEAEVSQTPLDPQAVADGWVLGLATGYSRAQLEPFVKSLRACFTGHVTLMVDPDQALISWLTDHRIEAAPAPLNQGWKPAVVVSRFAWFAQQLRRAPADCAVLLTDTRDVVFQSPLFDPRPNAVEAFVEDDGLAIADHDLNIRYIEALMGAAFAQKMLRRPPLCAGTIAGPAGEVAKLCRIILTLCAIPRSGRGGSFGADQAAFNIAVHDGMIDVDVRGNYGRVATLGWPGRNGASASETGVIVNPDGSVSPIVHQYDRRPDLTAAVARRWDASPVIRHTRPTMADRWSKALASIRKRMPEVR